MSLPILNIDRRATKIESDPQKFADVPFLLRPPVPTPELSTLATLAAGALGLVIRRAWKQASKAR